MRMEETVNIITLSRTGLRRLLMAGLGMMIVICLDAQEVPSRPLSIPVYHPILLNPAFVGSKDYTNISLTARIAKSLDYQTLNLHQRITNKEGAYTRLGLGAFAFHEQLDNSWNSGVALSGAYHIALDHNHLHNLSLGVSAKGILFAPKHGEEFPYDTLSTKFRPNMDAGLYYYSPKIFVGLSSTSLFESDDSIAYAQLNREYHLYGGYKFVVSKKSGIVIEPSLLLTVNDQTISEPHKHLVPYLKVYLQNYYLGTYLKDLDIIALFFQYQFPRFNAGLFIEFPRIGNLNNDNIIFEVSLGLNLGKEGETFLRYRHW